jgi:hypothetical protein
MRVPQIDNELAESLRVLSEARNRPARHPYASLPDQARMTRVVARCVPRQNWHFSDNVAGQGQAAEALVQDLRRSNRILVGTSDGTKPLSCPGGPISWQFRTTTRSHFMGVA